MQLKALLRQGISHHTFDGDAIYNLRKIFGHGCFKPLFPKYARVFIKRGYDSVIPPRTACLVVSPYTVGHHAYLFGCAMTVRT